MTDGIRPPDAAARLAAANLTPQEMEIAAQYFWDGATTEQVALWHGMTLSDVAAVLGKIRHKLDKAGLRIRPEVLAQHQRGSARVLTGIDLDQFSPEESCRPDGSDWRDDIDDRIDREPFTCPGCGQLKHGGRKIKLCRSCRIEQQRRWSRESQAKRRAKLREQSCGSAEPSTTT